MNDMSGNRFVAASAIDWLDYSLNEVLFNSFALERETDANRILFYVTTILSSTGFRYGVNGFKYLAMLFRAVISHRGCRYLRHGCGRSDGQYRGLHRDKRQDVSHRGGAIAYPAR